MSNAGILSQLKKSISDAFTRYLSSYIENWIKYGVVFSILLSFSVAQEASSYVDHIILYTTVASFIISSFIMAIFQRQIWTGWNSAWEYNNPADAVAIYLGTKKAPPPPPPKFLVSKAATGLMILVWAGSFMYMILWDIGNLVANLGQLIKFQPSVWQVIFIVSLVVQFLVPILKASDISDVKDLKGSFKTNKTLTQLSKEIDQQNYSAARKNCGTTSKPPRGKFSVK